MGHRVMAMSTTVAMSIVMTVTLVIPLARSLTMDLDLVMAKDTETDLMVPDLSLDLEMAITMGMKNERYHQTTKEHATAEILRSNRQE